MKQRFSEEQFFGLALALGAFTTSIALVLYAYLGIFSRYGSDDYCLSAFYLQHDLLSEMIRRYFNASSRYTNILFIGLVDKLFGWHNVAILPALMLTLFVLGLYLLLKEIVEMIELEWNSWMVFFMSLSIVYFSISQAPDLYETLYWRAGMTSHFAPVVFMPFFGTFLIRQIRNTKQHSPSFWVQAACFISPILIGGLSEPPTALMITILFLAAVAAWWWSDIRYRRSILIILLSSLMGALIALIVMALAPANSIRMQTAPPGLFELVSRIVYYPSYFIIDTLRTFPVPTLASITVPALFFYVKYVHRSQSLSEEARNHLGILILLILIFTYLFIAASFAPSAYGQSYPVPRARFSARVLMTIALMTEGALLGILITRLRIKFFSPMYLSGFAIVMLMILMLYPLRTAWRIFGEIPSYQQRSAAWDLRESEIQARKAEGAQDLVVRFLSDERIQDLGDHTDFRLNRCAAALYGVNSIVAVPMESK
jgi:Family of unknown function (DUF6056)